MKTCKINTKKRKYKIRKKPKKIQHKKNTGDDVVVVIFSVWLRRWSLPKRCIELKTGFFKQQRPQINTKNTTHSVKKLKSFVEKKWEGERRVREKEKMLKKGERQENV